MRKALVTMFTLAGFLCFGNAAYLHAKAELGQLLLERAWARTLRGDRNAKPWGWADTTPLARIEFARGRRSYIVLSGASGRTMAWGPGHIDGTAMPGEAGNCVVSAHRDTQFAVLRDLRVGDEVIVQTRERRRVRYRVVAARVTNDHDMSLLAPSRERLLTLITCWPFDAIRSGGRGRYAVIAKAS